MHPFNHRSLRERIIVPLDWQSGQLKSTSPGRYWLPYFIYTGCRCRRGCRCRLYRHPCRRGCLCRRGSRCRRCIPRLHRHPHLHRHFRGRRRITSLEVRLFSRSLLATSRLHFILIVGFPPTTLSMGISVVSLLLVEFGLKQVF